MRRSGTKQDVLDALELSQQSLMRESRDAARYRKLRAWLIKILVTQNDVRADGMRIGKSQTFDDAIDALPEPEREA